MDRVIPDAVGRHPEQPTEIDIRFASDTFVKEVRIPRAGTLLPQHSHRYDHLSVLARGSVDVFADGAHLQRLVAPASVLIRAGVKHTFHTLADDCIVLCIHDIAATGDVEIAEEHHLVSGEH